jgi:hypothetical protein
VGKGGISVLRSVGKYSFALAHKVFRSSLESSSRWLVVGYSLRDEVINEMLREVFSTDHGSVNVLVVTKGNGPSRSEVETAFGWDETTEGSSTSWLSFFREGAESLMSSHKWETSRNLGA